MRFSSTETSLVINLYKCQKREKNVVMPPKKKIEIKLNKNEVILSIIEKKKKKIEEHMTMVDRLNKEIKDAELKQKNFIKIDELDKIITDKKEENKNLLNVLEKNKLDIEKITKEKEKLLNSLEDDIVDDDDDE